VKHVPYRYAGTGKTEEEEEEEEEEKGSSAVAGSTGGIVPSSGEMFAMCAR